MQHLVHPISSRHIISYHADERHGWGSWAMVSRTSFSDMRTGVGNGKSSFMPVPILPPYCNTAPVSNNTVLCAHPHATCITPLPNNDYEFDEQRSCIIRDA